MNNTTATATRHHNITLKGEVQVIGLQTSPGNTHNHLAYTVEFWGIELGSKQCQYGLGWTDSLDVANSWAEQIRSGLLPEETSIRILHQCR